MSKKADQSITKLFFPKISSDIADELDRINLNNIMTICIIVVVIELIGIIPANFYVKDTSKIIRTLISLTYCISVCGTGAILCAYAKRRKKLRHRLVSWSIFIGSLMMLGWGMYISYSHYISNEQIVTFYCVVCMLTAFVNYHPMQSIFLIFGSFLIYYIILYSFDMAATLQPFNFFSFGLLLTAASIGLQRRTIQHLSNKKEIRHLNESLQQDILSASDQVIEKELEISNMKIRLMQQQISPHFIFNALGIIKSLIWEDRDKAEESVTDFSLYLRRNIEALRSTEMVLFSKELEHINAFLAIEKADDTVDLSIEYDLNANDFHVPALSVEPIVENAVIHGVSKLEKGARIRISTLELPDEYRIIIADNGTGFDTTDNKKSVGIENVRTRLKYQCGGSLNIASNQHGTTVTIFIPKTEVQYENPDFRR